MSEAIHSLRLYDPHPEAKANSLELDKLDAEVTVTFKYGELLFTPISIRLSFKMTERTFDGNPSGRGI